MTKDDDVDDGDDDCNENDDHDNNDDDEDLPSICHEIGIWGEMTTCYVHIST